MFDQLLTPDALISLTTLTVMEIVLGIDNIIFISILVDRLPASKREMGRRIGLMGALLMRLGLLFSISWIVGLTQPLFTVANFEVTGRALILIVGGLFLLFKATREIHEKIEDNAELQHAELGKKGKGRASFSGIIIQIMILDLVFSIDSVITAVGMTPSLVIMVTANVLAMAVMLLAGKSVGEFISRHPTFKMLALSFLLMIGLLLVAEGAGFHFPKGYAYFAMAFSVFVEFLNMKLKKKTAG